MEKFSINDAIRTARYYDMQSTFEDLYKISSEGRIVKDLYSLIASPNNIKLAYRRIKSNQGSKTAGVDKETINFFKQMTEEQLVNYIQNKLDNYQPSQVRRMYIPKPNGKKRPLGIPSMVDRICQQAIRQILEPICEAKFNKHSYGFRPLRSTENAIADVYKRIQQNSYYWAISLDIKGFFDNVNHRRMRQALWGIGIRDTRVLQILQKIIKADIREPDGEVVKAELGTPQGGIISPLLANIYLNCLDWWMSDQWETFDTHMKKPPKGQYHKSGERRMSNEYRALRISKLKEFVFVRYADDVVVLCKSLQVAKKLKVAIQNFLAKNLKLEISEEKTKIVNLKKGHIKCLGLEIGTRPKGNKYVVESHMAENAIRRTKQNLAEQIKKIQKPPTDSTQWIQIARYNSMVMGIQNYYPLATHINLDLSRVQFELFRVIENRLHPTKKGEIKSPALERFSKSKQVQYIAGRPILPIGYIQCKKPMNKETKANIYTKEGVSWLGQRVKPAVSEIQQHMLANPIKGRSIEYNDNRLSLVSAQHGKDKITGLPLKANKIECHHIIPVSKGGSDDYKNLILVDYSIHKLIHATNEETIQKYLKELDLDAEQMEKLNKYRKLAGNEEIKQINKR